VLRAILILFLLVESATKNEAYAASQQSATKFHGTISNISILADEIDKPDKLVEIKISDGSDVESVITQYDPNYTIEYKIGDRVIVQALQIDENQFRYIITDFNRLNYLGFLLILFLLLAIVIGKKYGFYSLVGMFLSFFAIFKFLLPMISKGANPVVITVLTSFVIVPTTFYLSHGINKKTHVAVVSTFISLIITSIFAAISVRGAKLTGLASEEAMFLQIGNSEINMRGILLSGIIIGFLGVMDDVTVSQAAIVMKLNKTKRNMSTTGLYSNAMDIGKDHISSMINTLILVYAGAALPLLLLFINSSSGVLDTINIEIIADEIVRTLVGSIGLIISVPIATAIAALTAE